MALQLPNGSTIHIGSQVAALKNVTAATNAAETVLTANAHGLANGDFVIYRGGWSRLANRVFRVTGVDANSFKLEKQDTSDAQQFPAGQGIGTVQKITAWTWLSQILEVSTSGGEQQFYNFAFLEDDFERQIPTTESAASLTIKLADDPTLAGYIAAKKAADSAGEVALQIKLKNGSVLSYLGYLSLNETPTLTRNEAMAVTVTFSLSSKPVRV